MRSEDSSSSHSASHCLRSLGTPQSPGPQLPGAKALRDSTQKCARPRTSKPRAKKRRRIAFPLHLTRPQPATTLQKVLNSLFSTLGSSSDSDSSVDQCQSNTHIEARRPLFLSDNERPSIKDRRGLSQHDLSLSLDLVGPQRFFFSSPKLENATSDDGSSSRSRISFQPSVTLSTPALSSRLSFVHIGHIEHSNARSSFDNLDNTSSHHASTKLKDEFIRRDSLQSLASLTSAGALQVQNNSSRLVRKGHSQDCPRSLPLRIVKRLLLFLETEELSALRLTSRCWYIVLNALKHMSPHEKSPGAAQVLPTEIIQLVYNHCHPKDFNALRHTCRAWMSASLDQKLLVGMIKRGGWQIVLQSDLIRRFGPPDLHGGLADNWYLSRRLARECALAGAWSGNGLQSNERDNWNIRSRTAFRLKQKADFLSLACLYTYCDGYMPGELLFSTSACGHYLLVAEKHMIYVYQLEPDRIVPFTSLICPRKVLAMCMDVSGGRRAIAALLHRRMGMFCELHQGRDPALDYGSAYSTFSYFEASIRSHQDTNLDESFLQDRSSDSDDSPGPTNLYGTSWNPYRPHNAVEIRAGDAALRRDIAAHRCAHRQDPSQSPSLPSSPSENNSSSTKGIPLEIGPRRIYRNLCSQDDPPRSVSICPSRKCVAFGCFAGIELHWVDSESGMDLNRWFPLSAPTDYLNFLAPRAGVDSSRRLRLISSAAHPAMRAELKRQLASSLDNGPDAWLEALAYGEATSEPESDHLTATVYDGRQVEPVDYFPGSNDANMPSTPPPHQIWPRSAFIFGTKVDHYHAVPLSDGYHYLFTDPKSNLVCLGTDAPLGGPVKLRRKIIFVPPADLAGGAPLTPGPIVPPYPRLYAVGQNLEHGLRIAITFGNTIVFYSVPADVFHSSLMEERRVSASAHSTASQRTEHAMPVSSAPPRIPPRNTVHESRACSQSETHIYADSGGIDSESEVDTTLWHFWWRDAPLPAYASVARTNSLSQRPFRPIQRGAVEPENWRAAPLRLWTTSSASSSAVGLNGNGEGIMPLSHAEERRETHPSDLENDETPLPWPLHVDGQIVGSLSDILVISVLVTPEISIWAFSKDGKGTCWTVDSGDSSSQSGVVKWIVRRDGGVREVRVGETGWDHSPQSKLCRTGHTNLEIGKGKVRDNGLSESGQEEGSGNGIAPNARSRRKVQRSSFPARRVHYGQSAVALDGNSDVGSGHICHHTLEIHSPAWKDVTRSKGHMIWFNNGDGADVSPMWLTTDGELEEAWKSREGREDLVDDELDSSGEMVDMQDPETGLTMNWES